MMLPYKDAGSIQGAIDLKRRVAQVSSAPRRTGTPRRFGASVPALFLVKPDAPSTASRAAKQKAAGALVERDKTKKNGSGNLVEMRLKPTPEEKERLLGTMAAMGPLLWLGHVLLTWLKIL